MVLAAFAEKGPLPPKEEAYWRVLPVAGFVIICEAFIGMEPYGDFSRRALSVGETPSTASMGGFTLAVAKIS